MNKYRYVTSDSGVRKNEATCIAEKVLGKPLPRGAHVHHVNEIKNDNRNSNLVICQSIGYHNIIHGRMRSLRATGDVHNRKCKYCKQYDKRENMYYYPRGKSAPFHRECFKTYFREWTKRALEAVKESRHE